MSIERPSITVVATPIGNLADISERALVLLRECDLVLAEDTRISRRLLEAYGIGTPLQAFHAHNEHDRGCGLLERARRENLAIALISDAGTPLISDPGYALIRDAHASGIRVSAVPGPCAAIMALVMSGLPADEFTFLGFLPARGAARRERLRLLAAEHRTSIAYEAPHRLHEFIADARSELGDERPVFVARELTKLFESSYRGTLGDIESVLAADPNAARGELVIVLGPAPARQQEFAQLDEVLKVVLEYLRPGEAVALAARIVGAPRNLVYKRYLETHAGKLQT